MKILKINAILLMMMLALASCEEKDPEVFDGENTDNQVLIGFSDEQYNLPVAIESTGEVEVKVEASTISKEDRVFSIDTINSGSVNEAFPETYSIPSTVTIPAGEYIGTFTITGEDNSMVEPEARLVEIELSSQSDDPLYSIQQTQVRVFEVCPVPESRYVDSTWNVSSVVCAGDGNGNCNPESSNISIDYQVTMEAGEKPSEFVLSDITGGLYPELYGGDDNPATISENCFNLTLDAQPDVVYGDDEFNGSGSISFDNDGNVTEFEITWSNNYGDAGTSTFTLVQ